MGNGTPVEVPPVSDPVCIYCGTNRSDGPYSSEYWEVSKSFSFSTP